MFKYMSGSIKKFFGFINKDLDSQDESKTLAVLIRSSSVILALEMGVLGFYSFVNRQYTVTFCYLVIMAVLCHILYITYTGTVLRALIFMDLVTLILACVGTSLYSWDSFFYAYIYFIMLALFFYTKLSPKSQIICVSANAAVLLLLAMLKCNTRGRIGTTPFVTACNILTFTGLILAVGLSFASKFARTEYKLYQYNLQLKKLAGSDPLTGLMNRRNMLSMIDEIIPRMVNGVDMMSVAIGDIDFFKKVNDSRGHDCGDYVLKELSKLFESFMEHKGYAARWGGEEFLFVFVHGNADDAYVDLETLRNTIEKKTFEFADHEFKITMTFGLEEHNVNEDIDETIKKADEKLYMGKESGRNKVVY